VSLDGKQARLESLDPNVKVEDPTASATAATTTATDAAVKEEVAVPAPPTESTTITAEVAVAVTAPATDTAKVDWSAIQSELAELVGLPAAKEVVELLDPQQESSGKKFVCLPRQADKDTRRRLHQWIRERIAFCGVADTEEGAVRIWDKQFEREMPFFGKYGEVAVAVPAPAAESTTTPMEIAAVEEEPSSRKRKEPPSTENNNDNDAEKQDTVKVDWSAIQTELAELVGLPAAKEVVELLDPQQESSGKKFVCLPRQGDKDTRRRLHHWIRERIAFCGVADTAEGAVRIWDKQFEREMPNFGKFDRNNDRNNSNQKGGGDSRGGASGSQPDRGGGNGQGPSGERYLQFVLYKENMDTGGAINQIQKRSSNHRTKLRVGYAGMKDKRGITSQFITVPASTPIRSLCTWNQPGNGGGHTTTAGVGVVRVGGFEYTDTELRLGRLRGNRFDVALRNVRYPGHDKVTTQALLEKAALALRKAGFINYFGMQRFGKYHDTHLTGVAVLKGDYEKAVEIIMEPKPEEREQIAGARKAWAERFQAGGDRASAEKACAGKVVREFSRFMASEVAIVQSLSRKPLDYKRAFSCISKTMRMMFIHALQSYLWNHAASFRIEKLGQQVVVGDLVLVDENKNDTTDNSTTSGIPAVKVVTSDEVAAGSYTLEDIVLPLIGAGTRDPENECSKVYDDLLEKQGLTRKMLNQLRDRDFNCGGDYRKVLCRPSDVDFEILEYKDSLTPLMQTDLMKINGIELDLGTGKEDDSDEPLLAMVVGFTLPSSSYATIALRELMKIPTSSEYQGKLKLGDKADETKNN
jgi:tRNA pseudouridine13 synthase